MYKKFKANIVENQLLKDVETVIIGLSGGYDSMALALCFLDLARQEEIRLVFAHVNHMVREEAKEDESFVKDFAEKTKTEFCSTKVDMRGLAIKEGLSEEEAGRKLRYEFFYDLASKYPKSIIATGHNLSDQAETVLLNLIRGSGLRGLGAMGFKSGKIVRPILNIDRRDIEAYVDEAGFGHVDDYTNFENDYRRNSLRNQLIPLIKENYNPAFDKVVFSTSQILREDYEIVASYIGEIQEKIVKIEGTDFYMDKDDFENLSQPVKKRLLRKLIQDLKANLRGFESSHIEEFIKTSQGPTGSIKIINSIEMHVEYDKIKLRVSKQKPILKPRILGISNSEFYYGAYKINFEILGPGSLIKSTKTSQYFSLDKLDKIEVRPRENGDKLRVFGLGGSKKVKDLLIDAKIARDKRDLIPIFTDGNDIIWLGGLRRSSLHLVDDKTEKILKITIEEKNEADR